MIARATFAPKVPLAWVVRLYEMDAAGRPDDELAQKIGKRLWDRCSDLMVADSELRCAMCESRFAVHWIGVPVDEARACPRCDWRITAGEYHDLIEHRDLLGGAATPEVARFVERLPLARDYAERLRLIDALVHAIHRTGGRAARNVVEGRASDVIRTLDTLSKEKH